MKYLLIITMTLLSCSACKDKKPEPEEYFSFYADGAYFNYPQEKNLGFGGDGQTLKAFGAHSAGYIIQGYSLEDPVAGGGISIYIGNGQLPHKDTILLNDIEGHASLKDFKEQANNYYTDNQHTGMVIFTKRTSTKLEGTFEFTAKQQYNGSIIHIKKGKFSIIPTP